MNKPKSSGQGAAAAAALAPNSSVEFVLGQADTPEKFSAALAKLFAVRATEVALLKLEKGLLRFLCPSELKTAGSIPVSSSTAIAAHTAVSKKTELFNSFVKVKHASVFETVRLTNPNNADEVEQCTIQKLMSAPVIDAQKKVVGVVQVCRKGYDLQNAGPDFTQNDLQQLEFAASVLAKAPFMTQGSGK